MAQSSSEHLETGIGYENDCEYEKAIDSYRKHMEITEDLNDEKGMGEIHKTLGNLYYKSGKYEKAISSYGEAMDFGRKLGDIAAVAQCHENLGNVYQSIGEYQKAIESHQRNLDSCKILKNRAGVGKAHGKLGITYECIGEYEKAIQHYSIALDIANEQRDMSEMAITNGNMGNLYNSIGQYMKAKQYFERQLQIASENDNKREIGRAIGNIGKVHNNLGTYEKAINFHMKHREIAEELGDARDVGKACGNIGNVYHNLGQYLKAIECHLKHMENADKGEEGKANGSIGSAYYEIGEYQKAIEYHHQHLTIAKRIGDVRGEAIANFNLGSCRQINDSISACSFFAKSILTYDRLRRLSIFNDELNASMSNSFILVYERLLRNLLNLKQVKAALLVSDSKKAKALYDLVKRSVNVLKDSTLDANYSIVLQAIADNPCSKTVEVFFDGALADVINMMQDGSILSYTFDDLNVLHAWVISKNGVFHKEWKQSIPSNAKYILSDEVDDEVDDPSSIFISLIEEYLVGPKILIVQEGSLYNLQFPALRNSENERLGKKYRLQFTPAMHVLNSCLSKPLAKIGPALFVGNPANGITLTFKGHLIMPGILPSARCEVEDCSKYFTSQPLLGAVATKENVLMKMKDASIIHIAAHGVQDGIMSGIFLAPNEESPENPSEEHYLLTTKDVLNCTLVARLVVLSCCHSISGEISPEGVVGLARAFLGAGARSVLAPLRMIKDDETKEFIKLIYASLYQRQSVCVSLQEAICESPEKNITLETWASFQIVGEDISFTENEFAEIGRLSLRESKRYCEDKFDGRSEAAKSFPYPMNWLPISKFHHDRFEKLSEYCQKTPREIKKINGVRVCCKSQFKIGSGSNGTRVYIALSEDGYERAVKRLDKQECGHLGLHEKSILNTSTAVHSKSIVRYWFYDDETDDEYAYLILDLCEETLKEYIAEQSLEDLTKEAPVIISQILEGLNDLHREPEPILHRDLKPSNIMRNVQGKWLLTDFGISRKLTEEQTTYHSHQSGTQFWRAVESYPTENMTGEDKVRYKKQSDVQVAGMVAFHILTKGDHPYGSDDVKRLQNLIAGTPVRMVNVTDPVAKDLISWMLQLKPSDRPYANEALKHPYLQLADQQFGLLESVGNEEEIKSSDSSCDVVKEINTDPLLSGSTWKSQILPDVLAYLCSDGRHPVKYGDEWTACLRLIRNKSQHWNDVPRPRPKVHYEIGEPQDFFLKVFPTLPVVVHRVIRSKNWKSRKSLEKFF